MSGPYRFTQDSTRSPLDRQAQNLFPPGQGPSFKTNVNRSKTKKWVEAKKNAYDGDDWGDYDEYDEYGVDQEPAREPTPPPVHRQAQRIGEPPSRSFTDPQRQGPVHPARRNSFEADEEHRSFSTGAPHPAHREAHREDAPYGQQGYGAPPPRDPGLRQVSVAHSDASDTLQHRRDFSPSAMVQPLQTKISTASSLGQASSPSAMSPTDRTPANSGKPLPFIRPADIYKRAEEERQRERASLDASRPSLDSLSGPARETYSEPGLEKKNDLSSNTGAHPSTAGQPALPPLQSVGSFGGDFWSTNSPTQTSRNAPVASPRDDQGLRSVVDQAFTRADDQRSVPPTPKPSDVSRSNTDSTMGISPIMSRVPSSATSALKNRNQAGGDSSTPVIAEEAGETPTLVAQPGTTPLLGHPQHIVRKPSPTHSRNVSSSSLPLATPTRGESPARSPAINPLKTVPVPESAQLTSLDTSSPESMAGGLGGPAAAYANREADIASAIRLSPVEAVPGLSIAERDSQNAFLESHQNAQSPIQDTIPRSRSESPNKGRVQELAGKFGDVSQSRRGSTQSNASRNSVQSWERSQDNSRPSSPTKPGPSTERPTGTREVSFRPSLPGQWESYATTIPTPSELSDTDKQLAGETGRGLENNAVASPLGDADITPTTSKHVASPTGPSESSSDPLTGLKAAGAAIGAALQSSLGAGAPSKEDNQEQPVRDRSFGDVYVPRPVQFDRTASSVSSSIPPTPPAKDTPVSEEPPSLVPLNSLSPNQQQTPTRPAMLPQLSTLPSDQDEESDRLRKEIVASLSPVQSRDLSVSDANQTHLQTGPASSINRDSSILPSEYDSYWAGETVSPPPAQSTVRQVPDSPDQSAQTASSPAADIPQSSLLTRFSWEDRSLQPGSHDQTQGGAVMSSSNEPPSTTVTVPTIQADDTPASPQPTEPTSIPSPVSGLHVVNSAINPEAVDMPPRLSAEVSSDYQYSDSKGQASLDPLTKHDAAETGKISIPQETDFQKNAAQESSAIKSPTDKPLGSREISNIKSPPERIDTYNVTREYWANADHGLQDWISSALAASPDLASQTPTHDRPQMAPNSGSRHKPAASLSLFGKHHTFGPNNQPPSQTPGTPTPSGGAPESRPYGPGPGGAGGKITSQQMQAKGKDLLHTAGVLGGKGMTGAKGLFAKGKSRFRASGSDKVDK